MLESFTKIEAAFVEVPTKTAVIVNSFLSSLRIPRIKSFFESHWRMTYNRYSQNNIKFIVNEDLFCTFISIMSLLKMIKHVFHLTHILLHSAFLSALVLICSIVGAEVMCVADIYQKIINDQSCLYSR